MIRRILSKGVPLQSPYVVDAIKCHRTTIISTPTTGAWTDFTGFTAVTDESHGPALSLNVDTKTIDIAKKGLYQFSGCIHFQNNTGTAFTDLTVLSRILVNGTDEARCSQRAFVGEKIGNSEGELTYNGTAFLDVGDSLTLQYYTNAATLDFFANSNFDTPVAATILLEYLGVW